MTRQQPPTTQRLVALLIAVLLLNALLAACAIPPEEPAAGEHAAMAAMAAANDNSAVMSGHDHPMVPAADLPAEALAADARTQEAYRFAIANRAAAEEVPCYCGCVGLGHMSSYDCYVADVAPNGALVFDAHALNCQVCVDITQDTMRLLDEGRAPPAIKQYIDETYSAYGPPTPLDMADHSS